jgi:predicted O-linked N-acetylglucosamine transferase (SPINDLY family)
VSRPPATPHGQLLERALASHRAGQLPQAIAAYRQLLAAGQGNVLVWRLYGTALHQIGQAAESVVAYAHSLRLDAAQPAVLVNQALAMQALARWTDAAAACRAALALDPALPEAHNGLAISLRSLGRQHEALEAVDRALALRPGLPDAQNNRGLLLRELGRLDEALTVHEQVIAQQPGSALAHNNLGIVLHALHHDLQAIAHYRRALELQGDFAEAHNNLAIVLHFQRHIDEALQHYERAILLQPDFAEAHAGRAMLMQHLKRPEETLRSLEEALRLKPDAPFLRGQLLHARMHEARWEGLAEARDTLRTAIAAGQPVCGPFPLQGLIDDPQLQRRCAEIYTLQQFPAPATPLSVEGRSPGQRIKIAYLSSDFGDHPVSHLMAPVLESHDRARFEILVFALTVQPGDWRDRIGRAVDRVIDVEDRSDLEVAQLCRLLGVDIAVDLNGHTSGARTAIFAHRAAPIQASYVGYLGTLGAPFMDYLLADSTLIPPAQRAAITEAVISLPTYHCHGDLVASASPQQRQAHGLPESGFVFCCFNQAFKITPEVFASWLRILASVPGSVLWLYVSSADARARMLGRAETSGLGAERLVFADRVPAAEHQARQGLADLFLDTHPYNAGATAGSALAAGLPVLTCAGNSFASRIGASVLTAARLPELITHDSGSYERMAIRLASDAAAYAEIRRRVAEIRDASPLFDLAGFTAALEAAYQKMHSRQRSGLPAVDFSTWQAQVGPS